MKASSPIKKNVLSVVVVDLRHVVIGGYRVADLHSPRPAEKIVEIKVSGLAAVTGINPYNSRRRALDSGEKHASLPDGARRAVRPRSPLWERPGLGLV